MSAIGGSVMLGVVDDEVGLQVYDAIGILKSRGGSGQPGNLMIVHLGNNGTITRQEFDQIMLILSGVDKVVFVNLKVPAPGRSRTTR